MAMPAGAEASTLRKICLEFGQQTSSHGIANVMRGKSLQERAFWIVVLFLAVVGFFFGFGSQLQKYLAHRVETKVSSIYGDSLEFPAISVCALNPFGFASNLAYLNEFIVEENRSVFEGFAKLHYKLRYGMAATPTETNFMCAFPRWQEFFIYEGDPDKYECEILREYMHHIWGHCITLYPNQQQLNKKYVKFSGKDHSLTVGFPILFDSMAWLFTTGPAYSDYVTGVAFAVHPRNIFPADDQYTLIMPADFVDVSVHATVVNNVPFPTYSWSCIDEYHDDMYDEQPYAHYDLYSAVWNTSYTKVTCIQSCLQKISLEKCGCTIAQVPSTVAFSKNITGSESIPPCAEICEYDAYRLSTTQETVSNIACRCVDLYFKHTIKEDCNCPDACEKVQYRVYTKTQNGMPVITFTRFKTKKQVMACYLNESLYVFSNGTTKSDKLAHKNQDIFCANTSSLPCRLYEEWKLMFSNAYIDVEDSCAQLRELVWSINDEYTYLRLYFDSHYYLRIDEYISYRFYDFIADVGGVGGLYLGLSAVAVLEWFIFLCSILRHIFYKGILQREVAPFR